MKEVVSPALRCVGNLVTGDDVQTQVNSLYLYSFNITLMYQLLPTFSPDSCILAMDTLFITFPCLDNFHGYNVITICICKYILVSTIRGFPKKQ